MGKISAVFKKKVLTYSMKTTRQLNKHDEPNDQVYIIASKVHRLEGYNHY